MENLITKNFKGQEIIFKEIEGQHMVRINEVAQFCGWTTISKGKEYIRIDRANKHLKTLGLPLVTNGDFIPEFAMYALIGKANNAAATEFMLWVGQTLTELRTKGVVILDHASQETINFEEKFGKYRIRRTFTESNNLREDWKQLKTLSREQKLNGTERLKLYNITFSAIQDRLNNNLTELRGSELLAMQELLTEIKSDTLELSNRVNGGKKSNLTRKLNMVNEQLVEAQDTIRYIRPENEEYYYMDIHGFTVNRMYEPNTNEFDMIRKDFKDRGTLRKTTAYKVWIEDFNIEMDKLDLDINFENGIDVYLYFDHMEKFDAHNFHKTFFDCFAAYYGVDDRNFHLKVCDTNYFVDSYEEGRIYFCIREREAE